MVWLTAFEYVVLTSVIFLEVDVDSVVVTLTLLCGQLVEDVMVAESVLTVDVSVLSTDTRVVDEEDPVECKVVLLLTEGSVASDVD